MAQRPLLGRAAPQAARALGCVLGAGAVAAGVGLVPHLTEGLAPLSVLAVLLLVSGVALLVAVTRNAWRRHGRWARAALVPGTVLLVGLAVLTLGQAVAATVAPRGVVGATPSDVGLGFVDVRARTAD